MEIMDYTADIMEKNRVAWRKGLEIRRSLIAIWVFSRG